MPVAQQLAAETGGHYWTSSPTPSGRPTGAATTTSPKRSSRRCGGAPSRCRLDRVRCRHRRHLGHDRPLHPLPAAATRLCVVDPRIRCSRLLSTGDATLTSRPAGSGIEGIGRPRVEPSFVPGVVDRMIAVPDAAILAAMRCWASKLGRRCGGSTGTNLYGALRIVAEMHDRRQAGAVVTLICDFGGTATPTPITTIFSTQKRWSIWARAASASSGAR